MFARSHNLLRRVRHVLSSSSSSSPSPSPCVHLYWRQQPMLLQQQRRDMSLSSWPRVSYLIGKQTTKFYRRGKVVREAMAAANGAILSDSNSNCNSGNNLESKTTTTTNGDTPSVEHTQEAPVLLRREIDQESGQLRDVLIFADPMGGSRHRQSKKKNAARQIIQVGSLIGAGQQKSAKMKVQVVRDAASSSLHQQQQQQTPEVWDRTLHGAPWAWTSMEAVREFEQQPGIKLNVSTQIHNVSKGAAVAQTQQQELAFEAGSQRFPLISIDVEFRMVEEPIWMDRRQQILRGVIATLPALGQVYQVGTDSTTVVDEVNESDGQVEMDFSQEDHKMFQEIFESIDLVPEEDQAEVEENSEVYSSFELDEMLKDQDSSKMPLTFQQIDQLGDAAKNKSLSERFKILMHVMKNMRGK